MVRRKTNAADPTPDKSDISRLVLDSLSAEVAVLDKHGTIVDVNDAWKRFALANGGSPETTGVGVNYLEVCRKAEDDESFLADKAYCGIRRVLDGAQTAFMLEYPCHSDTEHRWFLLSVSRLKSKRSHVVTTHLSITERKRTEQQLLVAERLAAIGEAMQGLSHEGRNALQRAQAGLELLRLHVEEDDEALRLLERIENAQTHLLELYEEVRSYAAPITLQRERVLLSDLVEQAWTSCQSPTSTVEFSQLAGTGDLTCTLDPAAIGQVLKTVFDNALATDTESREIEVSYHECVCGDGPGITLVISDDGTGVPELEWETIFRPFYTTKLRGTGLGLAVCRRIVSAHRGQIGLSTPRLGGTSVFISLPRH